MKAETLEKRAKKHLTTKKGELKKIYEDAIWWLRNRPTTTIRPCKWGHKYASLIDKTSHYTDVLTALGVDYEHGNDAPRGGKEGDYIKLTKKGLSQIRSIRKDIK